MNVIPGEQARREATRWVIWSYMGLAVLAIVLHIMRSTAMQLGLNWVYLILCTCIFVAAVYSLVQLKSSFSRAILLFSWVTFVCLVVLFTHEIVTGQDYAYLFTMFYVGIFTLGIILGYKAALHYMIATGIVFFVLGALYLYFWDMIVPVVVAYGFTIPAKVVERLIDQSTRDLAQINRRLENQVAERTAELAESNRRLRADVRGRAHVGEVLRQRTVELESRNEELNAYAHTVAHDIKSPLAAIIGFGELLERHYTQFTDQQLTYYFGVIARNGRKITNIVDELLLLSSVREAQVVDIEPLDMATIVDEARHRLVHDIAETVPEIILPDAWPVAIGHAPWVEEIWTNYINNAVKYGGVPPASNSATRFWILERQFQIQNHPNLSRKSAIHNPKSPSGCATTAPASPSKSRVVSSRPSPGLSRREPKATAWDCPSCGGSRSGSTAKWASKVWLGRAVPSSSHCLPRRSQHSQWMNLATTATRPA